MNRADSKGNLSVIIRVLGYLKKYTMLMCLSLLLAAVSAILSLYLPILIGRAVDCAVSMGQVDFASLFNILKLMVVLVAIAGVASWFMNIINNHITYAVVRDIRQAAFEKLGTLPLSYLDKLLPGDIVSRIISDADQFADGLLMGFTQFFTGMITIVGTLIFMLTINHRIAIIVVAITPLSLVVAAIIAKGTHSMFELQSKTRGQQMSYIDEYIGGAKVVHAFSREQEAIDGFASVNDQLTNCSLKAVFFSSTTNPATRFVNSLVYAAVAVSGAFAAIGGGLTVGQLTSFLAYANQYTKPFNEISSVVTELQNSLTCAGRLLDFIYAEDELTKADAIEIHDAKGNIAIEHVDFSYTEDNKLITDFNLNVKQGMKVAIVGPTGCGKTTIINLLMRFYDVDNGCIRLEGSDIRDISRSSLRSNYGMVLQETWLRGGSIKDNIRLGKLDATDEEIVNAAKKANAHGFIRRLEHGYDTIISDGDGLLSQGQRQLICIARVMLCMPPVLILDEATSSIDTMTEKRISEAFDHMTEGRTSFIVAHRLSTIKGADVILVMKDGHIVESGNHEELIANHGFYEELYLSSYGQG